MPRDNLQLSGPRPTITKARNSNKVTGTNSIVIKQWINFKPSDPYFTNPPAGKAQPTATQTTSDKINLRTASKTVDNSMNTDADLLLGVNQIRKITLPNFNHFTSILNNEQSLSNIDQTSPPSCAEILWQNRDNYLLPSFNQILWDTSEEHNEDAVPPIDCMLPPEYI